VRLLALPALAGFICLAAGASPQLLGITVIVAGMPAASNTTLIAELYGGDTETASSIVFLSTLFSVVTIPLMALLLA
jgi:predicted permease